VEELLRIKATLFPRFVVHCLERVDHLRETAVDPALFKAADRGVSRERCRASLLRVWGERNTRSVRARCVPLVVFANESA
jgi:hypothetical protein